ncbi:hypothetical protein [Paraburkholderia lacunae]|uniref:Uncharacterized protein n=1 Tax=Paraburkholderia lacunae TaxID=2211104 RepID=A0A370MW70_9BURK|nr:hypothetical protein [Paraburkholderia lacunae]RDJ97579.1 hypothetical protein DLM46_37055 [Paraburkholderia lacunae]
MNNTDALLHSMTELVTSNGKAVARFGAQVVVMSKFIDATFPRLTATQCEEIAKAFRDGIDDAMSLMDNITLPAEYRSTLLEQTNTLLNGLQGRSTTRR